MSSPQISVLMPAYAAAPYLEESIESILGQTYSDFEFIILDDASPDTTWQVIEGYARSDSRIVPARNAHNLGISKTRNELLKRAGCKYVAWLDADDIAFPYRLERQFAYMEAHPDIGISGGALLFFDGKRDLSIRRYANSDSALRSRIFRQSPVAQPAAIIRRAILEKTGYFDESLPQAEDLDLSLRIGRYAQFGNLDDVLIKYRFHPNSVTTSKMQENILATLKVRNRAEREYGYARSLGDRAVHAATYMFAWLPPRFTYFVFNVLRNSNAV